MTHLKRYELTDEEWARLEPLLPPERGHWGRPRSSNRQMLNGLFWVLRSGSCWRDMPERYGPWKSVYTRFYRWSRSGLLQEILDRILTQSNRHEDTLILDSTVVRAHQHAAGGKGGRKQKGWAEAEAALAVKFTC